MKGAIVLAVSTIVAVGLVFSDGAPGSGAGKPDIQFGAAQSTHTGNATSSAAYYGAQTTLDRAGDGHFYADVEVDGQSVAFLVDTGATTLALTGDDARDIGLDWDESDLRHVANGASGPVYGTTVQLDSVRLGPFEAYDVEAAIIPEGLGISLLGQSFLGTVPRVSIEDDRMVLGG